MTEISVIGTNRQVSNMEQSMAGAELRVLSTERSVTSTHFMDAVLMGNVASQTAARVNPTLQFLRTQNRLNISSTLGGNPSHSGSVSVPSLRRHAMNDELTMFVDFQPMTIDSILQNVEDQLAASDDCIGCDDLNHRRSTRGSTKAETTRLKTLRPGRLTARKTEGTASG
jgi:hypothetical protein